MLMEKYTPDGHRTVADVPLSLVMHRLAIRVAKERGIEPLSALADLRRAVEIAIERELLFPLVLKELTWSEIGSRLGVSAQAAHRKYHRPSE